MLQVPAPVSVTMSSETVQEPEALKRTGRPELAVALTLKGGPPGLSVRGSKVIV